MILSTHFIAGAAVASRTDDPLSLFLIAVLLHYFLDIFPHWQYFYESSELKIRKNQIKVAIDLSAGPLFVSILFLQLELGGIEKLLWLWLGGVFCMLPDFFALLAVIFPRNWTFEKMRLFHKFVQKYDRAGHPLLGVATQLAVVLIAIWILIP